ncbi:glucose-6-phosphate dehydrogenase assembly protein OpcA [Microlunatus sp. GCM10028923]|uniref:glucose-6-phosphate dehydrogenase assembly protein OpcA n=1 Tax=Microlunatus sp. GCM10028923 TaxID=3273400 RepID=UPI003614CFB9
MIISLSDTTSAKISSALLRARRNAGAPTMGMVLTLIIVTDEDHYQDALESAVAAGREHPCRILLVVSGNGRRAGLDAEVRIGEGTTGEVVIIRMRGELARHQASVVRPLLLPDSPVVIWWPGKCPNNPAQDELAQLARRRITDSATGTRPLAALRERAETYEEGDTDLSWTRLTPWRALLAASLDQYPARIRGAEVEAERSNPSAELLAAWLRARLKVEVKLRPSDGPGITAVRMTTAAGDIAITRPDGRLASYSVPGQPNRLVALKRREVTELITEELRRMDHDDVFAATLNAYRRQNGRGPAKKSAAKKSAGQRTAAAKGATQKTAAARGSAQKTSAAKKSTRKAAR